MDRNYNENESDRGVIFKKNIGLVKHTNKINLN